MRQNEIMKTWYKAVCDKCKDDCNIFVNNPTTTACILSKDDQKIQDWLKRHFNCELRLICRDDQLDKWFEEQNDFFKAEK